MKSLCFTRALAASLLLVTSMAKAGFVVQTVYENLPGEHLSDLTSARNYGSGTNLDGSPAKTFNLTNGLEGATVGLPLYNIGSLTRGFIQAPQDGDFTFYISSDGESELWMSSDTTPAHLGLVCRNSQSVEPHDWQVRPEQVGQRSLGRGGIYYFEIRHKKGGPGQFSARTPHVSVGWLFPETANREPDDWDEFPIKSLHLLPMTGTGQAPRFIVDPGGAHPIYDGDRMTLGSTVDLGDPATTVFQWYRMKDSFGGANTAFYSMEEEPGFLGTPPLGRKAVLSHYTDYLPFTVFAQNVNARFKASYQLVASNAFGAVTSSVAVVTVANHYTNGLPIASVRVRPESPSHLLIDFYRPLVYQTAQQITNYSVSPSMSVVSAKLLYFTDNIVDQNIRSVVDLELSQPLREDVAYTLTVNGVQDMSSGVTVGVLQDVNGNHVETYSRYGLGTATNEQRLILRTQHLIARQVYLGLAGENLSDLTNSVRYPASDDIADWRRSFETPDNAGTNYGVRLSGFVTAPTNGDYQFYLSAGGPAALFLSTDSTAGNKRLIASEPKGNASRSWTGTNNRNAAAPENVSAPVALQAGKRYYVEAVMKAGANPLGNLGVAWKLPGAATPAIGADAIAGEFLSSLSPSGPVTFSLQPRSLNARLGEPVTIDAAVSGNPPFFYQWSRDGQPIPGANRPFIRIGSAAAKDVGRYTVAVRNEFSEAVSQPAELDVFKPLQFLSAATLDGIHLGLRFSERLDPAIATNTANYSLGPGVRVLAAQLSADGMSVVLTIEGSLPDPFAITIRNLRDAAGNPFVGSATISGQKVGLTAVDIGVAGTNPIEAGSTIPGSTDSFFLHGGGSGADDQSDGLHFLHAALEGDFDVAVRVESLAASAHNSRAGILARESLDPASRMLYASVTPVGFSDDGSTGDAAYQTGLRDTPSGLSHVWNPETVNPPVTYPNAWIRLQRTGALFQAYHSADGIAWQLFDKTTQSSLSNRLLVGLFVTSTRNEAGVVTQADFRDLSGLIAVASAAPALEIRRSGPDVILLWPESASNYQLEFTPSLPAGWSPVQTAPQPLEGKLSVTIPASPGNRYFRLVK